MVNPIFVGPRASRKSGLGASVAQELGYDFVDIDNITEKLYGTVSEIIGPNKDWKHFRELESTIIEMIASAGRARVVYAPGGGAIAHEFENMRIKNMNNLHAVGKGIYLLPHPDIETSAVSLTERLLSNAKDEQRPAFTDLDPIEETRKTLRERDSFYREFAQDRIIYTFGKDKQTITQEALDMIRSWT